MYKIVYHPKVGNDTRNIPADWNKRIEKIIEERLSEYPEIFGKPLRRTLKNYFRLRVGDYRVIYRLEKSIVIILIIGHRSEVYDQILKRITLP